PARTPRSTTPGRQTTPTHSDGIKTPSPSRRPRTPGATPSPRSRRDCSSRPTSRGVSKNRGRRASSGRTTHESYLRSLDTHWPNRAGKREGATSLAARLRKARSKRP
ncbi:hypothetical protein KIPB_007515, partial [Kipferlia bialata]